MSPVIRLTGLMDSNWNKIRTFLAEQEEGRAFGISASLNATPASTENRFVYLNNPSGSGKNIFLDQFYAGINDTGGSDAVLYRFYLNPTPSANGTALVISKMLASGAAPSCLAYTAPTVADGSRGIILPHKARVHFSSQAANVDFRNFKLAPGDRLLITGTPYGVNVVSELGLSFFEEAAA